MEKPGIAACLENSTNTAKSNVDWRNETMTLLIATIGKGIGSYCKTISIGYVKSAVKMEFIVESMLRQIIMWYQRDFGYKIQKNNSSIKISSKVVGG